MASILERNGGIGRWMGTFDFPLETRCINHVRIKPASGVKDHISDLLEDCFDVDDLNRFEMHRLTNRVELETDSYGSEEYDEIDGGNNGAIDMFMVTDWPIVAWVKAVAVDRPSLYVRLDYQHEDKELFGRVLIHDGMTKECHLTPFPGMEA